MEKKTGKKPYTKPKFEFVEFSLSSSIASTCKYTGNHSDGNSCEYEAEGDNGWLRFTSDNFDCGIQLDDESYCYHVPTVDTSVFSS